ncbi:hypothetical protein [Streptomyces abyssomicinicus]|uniref:hypothetical protein n=1 Tax=Streptomyces abyssomicinicus TaxID=574929 RepID=UPI0012505867|nr:hypothetical protein [Streptomyces abyssomicinicus]
MNLVFGAEGLSVGEGAFLMACCNHTDARGYVIASMQQLADEAHMTERNARNNKQRLIKRGLLAAADRYHPRTGARIADLYRVNLDLLGQMQRKRTDYGPTVVEELTFSSSDETTGQTPPENFSAPPENFSAPPENFSGTPPEKSAPLLLPSSSPSSLSGVPAVTSVPAVSAEAVTEERERVAIQDHTPAPPAAAEVRSEHPEVPEQRSVQEPSGVDRVVDAYLTACMGATGMPPRPKVVRELRAAAAALLSVGRSVDNLCGLAVELAAKGWTDLARHAAMNPEAPSRPALSLRPWCGECNDGREPTSAAQRMVETPTGMAKCLCHPGYVPQPAGV